MKSIINRIFIASALTFSLSACSDFLNKEPLSQVRKIQQDSKIAMTWKRF